MDALDIDLTEKIRTIVAPLAKNPDSLLIRRMDKPEMLTKKEQHYLVVCEEEDLGRLIGRHGINSGSARTIINVVARKYKKRVHLAFDSFEGSEANS